MRLASETLPRSMKRVCCGLGLVEPVSSCEMMSAAVCTSPGDPVTTMLWLPGSTETLAVGTFWPLGKVLVRASVRILPTFFTSEVRVRKTRVTCTTWALPGVPATAVRPVPWTGLSNRLTRASIWSAMPAKGAATIRRLVSFSAMTRALVAAADPVSLAAATPGMA